MKKLGIGLILCAVVGCSVQGNDQGGSAPAPTMGGAKLAAFSPGSGKKIASRHTVVFRGDNLPADAAKKIANAGGTLVKALPEVGLAFVEGPASFDDKMGRDPSVLASGPTARVTGPKTTSISLGDQIGQPQDGLYPLQWNIRRVNAPGAWQHLPAGALDNVTVAVIDTGIADDHPEFNPGQVVFSVSMNVCNDPGGVPDRPGYPEYNSFAVVFPDGFICLPVSAIPWPHFPKLYQPHGTHVAGIVGANANVGLLTGVAPGVKLAAYKIMDYAFVVDAQGNVLFETGAGLSDSAFTAVVDATNKHFNVVNMSFGGPSDRNTKEGNAFYLAWDRVARYATKNGTLLVAAAGNDNTSNNGKLQFLPSDLPSVVSVSATATSTQFPSIFPYLDAVFAGQPIPEMNAAPGSDIPAFYSNRGAAVDLSAPGGDYGAMFDPATFNPQTDMWKISYVNSILSSVVLPNGEPGFDGFIGTSMASPHVAGVAALVRAKYPQLTPAEVKDRLKATAQQVGPRQNFGAGIVDAAAATAL